MTCSGTTRRRLTLRCGSASGSSVWRDDELRSRRNDRGRRRAVSRLGTATVSRLRVGCASCAESIDWALSPSKSVFDKLIPKPADHLATGLTRLRRDPQFMKVFACQKYNVITRRLLNLDLG